jgi:hypothetical protein
MKTLRISDDVHQKLTGKLGQLTSQTLKLQTYQDVLEIMLNQSVILPQDLLAQVEKFVREKKGSGFTTKEDFLIDAARLRLRYLSGEYEHVEALKEKNEKGELAIKEMDLPFLGVADFLGKQIETLLEKYSEWQQQKEEHKKRQRKRG